MKRTVTATPPTKKDYEIQKIVSHRGDTIDDIEYEVKWKNYPDSDNSWFTVDDFKHAKGILEAYQKKHKLTAKRKKVVVEESDSDENLEKEDEEEDEAEEEDKKDKKKKNGNAKEESDDEEKEEDSDEETYEVEAIVKHRKKKGSDSYMYTVSWKGYPGEDSEVPEEDLEGAQQLLTAYKKKAGLPMDNDKKENGPSSSLRTRSPEKKKAEPTVSSSRPSRAARRAVSPTAFSTCSASSDSAPPDVPVRPAMRARMSTGGRTHRRSAARNAASPQKAAVGSRSRSPILNLTPRRSQRDLPARRSLSERDGGVVASPSVASPATSPPAPKKYGFQMGLEIESVVQSWPEPEGYYLTRVIYKDPVPEGMKKKEVVRAAMLRTVCPDLLFDYYEQLLRG